MHSPLLLLVVALLAPFVAHAAPLALAEAITDGDDTGTIYLPCCFTRSEKSALVEEIKV